MANVLAELFQDTASAIREKTGETGTMKPAEFPEKIRGIQAGGGGSDTNVCPLSCTRIPNPETTPTVLCNNFALHPDGTKMVLTSVAGVYLYDIQTEPFTFIEVLEGSASSVSWGACYSADGTHLVVMLGGSDSTKVTVKTYDTTVSPYALVNDLIPSVYTTSSYFGQGRWAVLSPNGEILCITGSTGFVAFNTTVKPYTVLATKTGVSQPAPPVFTEDGKALYLVANNVLHTVTYNSSYKVEYKNIKYTIAEDRSMTLTTSTGIVNESTTGLLFSDRGKITSTEVGASLNQYGDGASVLCAFYEKTLPWATIMFDTTGKYIIGVSESFQGVRVTELLENGVRNYSLSDEYAKKTRGIKYTNDKKFLLLATTDASDPFYIFRMNG